MLYERDDKHTSAKMCDRNHVKLSFSFIFVLWLRTPINKTDPHNSNEWKRGRRVEWLSLFFVSGSCGNTMNSNWKGKFKEWQNWMFNFKLWMHIGKSYERFKRISPIVLLISFLYRYIRQRLWQTWFRFSHNIQDSIKFQFLSNLNSNRDLVNGFHSLNKDSKNFSFRNDEKLLIIKTGNIKS